MSDLAIVIGILSFIIVVPILIIFIVLKVSKVNRERKLQKYTSLVEGIVVKLVNGGLHNPSVVTVKYEVNHGQYEVSEAVKLQCHVIKLGPIPIGQRKTPVMGDVTIGAKAIVRYDPDNPSKAILQDNKGHIAG